MVKSNRRHSSVLRYNHPAREWEEALPIGNGRLGAMVFGRIKRERLQLNEDTLWSGFPRDTINYNALRYLKQSRKLLFKGKFKEAENLIDSKMLGRGTESYQPMADLCLEFSNHNNARNYIRTLDMDAAIAETTYTIDRTQYKREMFISPVDQVIVIRITSQGNGLLNLKASMTSLLHHDFLIENQDIVLRGKCPSHVASNFMGDHPKSVQYEESLGISFITQLRIARDGGKVTVSDKTKQLTVENAKTVTFYMSANSNFINYSTRPTRSFSEMQHQCQQTLDAALEKGFEKIKQDHIREHQRLFHRVDLQLGDSMNSELPTNQRLQRYKEGKDDPELEALYFQYGRYLLISSSRPGTQPANLQGIWNPHVQPPWNSEYTININTEMNYWPAEVCQLSECHEPLFDLLEDLSVIGKRTASLHYNARGWAAHHNVDIWRMSTPTDGESSWAFWPMGGVWLTQHLWEHYLFTQDEVFLKEKAWPIMKEAALFCLDWLVSSPKGDLVTVPSTSPENKFLTEDGEQCSVSYGSTMDLSLIRELFNHCIKACKQLKTDDEFVQQLTLTLKSIAPFKIGSDGQLQEWYEDFPESELGHRHFSHLYSLYPGCQINNNTPELFEASRVSIERRLLNGGGHTGWSCAWVINLYARLLKGEKAYQSLRKLLSQSTYPNLFDSHPPFQIDGNFGGTAGISEMLVQSHLGKIELLPALPETWNTGYVKGLKARGNFIVDIEWEAHYLKKAVITSLSGKYYPISYHNKELTIVHDGKVIDTTGDLDGIATNSTQIYEVIPKN